MAGGKIRLNGKVKASSILEVVIGMVIIVMVFGIAMMIFTRVSSYAVSGKTMRATAILEEEITKIKASGRIKDEDRIYGEFLIRLQIRPYANGQALVVVNLKAFDVGKKLVAELQEIIEKPDEQP